MNIYEFADALHEQECRINHIDGCDWHYRTGNPDRWKIKYSAHNSYLNYAMNLEEELPGISREEIIRILKSVRVAFTLPYKGKYVRDDTL